MNRQQQVIDINGFQVNVMDIEDKENEMIQFDKTNDMVQDFMTRTSINTEVNTIESSKTHIYIYINSFNFHLF